MKRIGTWLKELRGRKGVSQAQLSDHIAARYGIHLEPSRYSQMERGQEGPPTLKSFLAMVDYFNADIAGLLKADDDPGQITGLEFLYQNSELADELLQLRDNWGEAAAAQFLIQVSRSANEIKELDASPKRKGESTRAARPPAPASKSKKSRGEMSAKKNQPANKKKDRKK
ncbi:MAG: helix-turn-helix domain-containing protein [bacterium]|nr:helix-turn-helix domain-containing protein [bacterium]